VTVVLGAGGGLHEANLTAYLLAPLGESQFLALDAGTLLSGLRVATQMGSFADIQVPPASSLTLEGWILREHIKAYALSHAHLDHISGLVLNAPDDSPKSIFGLDATLDTLRDHVFNWQVWPNFGNEGRAPQLRHYTYQRLQPAQAAAIPGTSMTIWAFPLSHAGATATAFLIHASGFYVLYCGDTGPDAVEQRDTLHTLWSVIAPLVRANTLRGMFLEVSYPDERPDHVLFGHLTPKWLLTELGHLAQLVDPQHPEVALQDLTVVVTHIKPVLTHGPSLQKLILQQLQAHNTLGVRFIVASQGSRLTL
jgi:3',5'-cyclic-nucleotide phosphodiesterase